MAEADPGYGPPPGQPNGPARGGGTPFDVLAKQNLAGLDGNTEDPAFARRSTPPTRIRRRARSSIYRDVPLVTIQNTWSIDAGARGNLLAPDGQFYATGMLCDSIIGDDRVTATLNSRASALFGREARFSAADKSEKAKECLDAWKKWWPRLAGDIGVP